MQLRKTKEELRRLMELRRSNAASPIQNKKKYKRTRQTTRKMLDLSKE
jgi:hypothetical protein